MRLSEITRDIRKTKSQIDKLYTSYTLTGSSKTYSEILTYIKSIYPTGYPALDKTLEEYKASLISDVTRALKGTNNMQGATVFRIPSANSKNSFEIETKSGSCVIIVHMNKVVNTD